MKRCVLISGLIALLVFMASCEKDANVKLPDGTPRPVITCYISPSDTMISLSLTRTKPVFGNNQFEVTDPVTDAKVVLYGNNTSVSLIYNSLTRFYQTAFASMPILPGNSYKVKVTMSDGQEAEAETTVPESQMAIDKVTFENIEKDELNRRLSLSITDQPGKTNYYRMGFNFLYTFNTDTMYAPSNMSVLKTDINQNGKEILFVAEYNEYLENIFAYDIYLLNINSDYFNFYNSLSKIGVNSPFTEPTIVYTNVKGGLGVFAAYTRTKLRKFK